MQETVAAPDRGVMRSLDPRVMMLWRFSWLVRSVVGALVTGFVSRLLEPPVPAPILVGAVFFIGIAFTIAWPGLTYRHWRFQVRESDVFIRHGVLWRTTSVVPHGRIQHVDTQQGPIERALGLASVMMFTAGTVGAVTAIPGLATADAEALRERLAQLSGSDDAV